jgi:hypothetical protein
MYNVSELRQTSVSCLPFDAEVLPWFLLWCLILVSATCLTVS